LTRNVTVLLVHVVAATPRTALRYSSPYAIELVQNFFKKHMRINPSKVLELSDRFQNLEIDSRLEIGFEGKPRGFKVPSFAVYNHQSEHGIVIFEVETRVTARYIPPGAEYSELEIERTDFLNYYVYESGVKQDRGPCRVSYSAPSPAERPSYDVPRNFRQ
jgi:hypothetical protein